MLRYPINRRTPKRRRPVKGDNVIRVTAGTAPTPAPKPVDTPAASLDDAGDPPPDDEGDDVDQGRFDIDDEDEDGAENPFASSR